MNTRVGKVLGRFDVALVCFRACGKVECCDTFGAPSLGALLVCLADARSFP